MDEYIGIVKLFAGSFAPRGWAFCDGSLLAINQNQALFAILGTTYGGNGTTTFGLPDLRGRVAVGAGTGPGLPPIQPGQVAGSANNTLQTSQLPSHRHTLLSVSEAGGTGDPGGNFLAATGSLDPDYRSSGTVTPMNTGSVGDTGQGQPVNNMQPYLGMNYIICLQGIFPSRN